MPKPDPAHKETDKILAEMEKKLHSVYKQAYKEAKETADTFLKQFREMDKKKREQVKNGELDKDEYARWRRTQVFQSNNYRKMADTLAADMTHSNQLAASVINGYLPEVYAVNYNYGTYEIEKGSKINTSFTLYDRQTVERLLRDEPDLLPRKAKVDIPKDKEWNKKHINSAVTQGILQGETIDKISQRLAATVTDMSQTSAIRNARTMTTSAQNGGRIDSYKRAESMGIKLMQVWLSTLDNRTRHEHILLDGQKRKVGEPFEVDGEKIYFPGDPSAEPYLVYNCRCTLIGEVKGVDYKLSDVSQRDNKLGDMTYQEWKDSKRKQDEGEPDKPKEPDKQEEKPKPTPQKEEKPVKVEVPAPTVEKPDAVDEPIKPQEIMPDMAKCRYPTNEDYSTMFKEHSKKVSAIDKAQISKHEKEDGSPGGYVATHNYSNINSNMRNDGYAGNKLDEDDYKTIDSLRRAISECSLNDDYILTRYVNADYITAVYGIKNKYGESLGSCDIDDIHWGGKRVKETRSTVLDELKQEKGNTTIEKAFISASFFADKNIMTDKPVKMSIYVSKGTNCYIPKNRRESECIFADNSKLQLMDVVDSADGKIELIYALIKEGKQ